MVSPGTAGSIRSTPPGMGTSELIRPCRAKPRSEEHTSELQSRGHLDGCSLSYPTRRSSVLAHFLDNRDRIVGVLHFFVLIDDLLNLPLQISLDRQVHGFARHGRINSLDPTGDGYERIDPAVPGETKIGRAHV